MVKLICRTGKEKTQATQMGIKNRSPEDCSGIVLYSTARVTDATDEERVKTGEKGEEMLFWTKSLLDDVRAKRKEKGEDCTALVRFLRFKS